MTTTITAIMAIVNADTSADSDIYGIGRRGYSYDLLPMPTPITAAQRADAVTAIEGGTVADLSDVTALLATAAVDPVTPAHVWRIVASYPDMTVG